MNSINRNEDMSDWAKYIAYDKYGRCWEFSQYPMLFRRGVWTCNGEMEELFYFTTMSWPVNENSSESLIKIRN